MNSISKSIALTSATVAVLFGVYWIFTMRPPKGTPNRPKFHWIYGPHPDRGGPSQWWQEPSLSDDSNWVLYIDRIDNIAVAFRVSSDKFLNKQRIHGGLRSASLEIISPKFKGPVDIPVTPNRLNIILNDLSLESFLLLDGQAMAIREKSSSDSSSGSIINAIMEKLDPKAMSQLQSLIDNGRILVLGSEDRIREGDR